MAGQRVSRDAAAHPRHRRHLAFEARVGSLYLTRTGRVCKLLRMEHSYADADVVLTFGYVDADDQVIRSGPAGDGFELRECLAARMLVRVGTDNGAGNL